MNPYKHLFLLLLLSTFFLQVSGQEQDTSHSYVPDTANITAYWKPGDTQHYLRTKLTHQEVNGHLQEVQVTQALVSFEIVDSTTETYTVRYRIDSILHSVQEAGDFSLSDIPDIDYVYTTDAFGEYLYMNNLDTVTAQLWQLVDDHVSYFDPADTTDLRSRLEQIYGNQAFIEDHVLTEISMFHMINGYNFPLYEEISFDGELPNLFDTTQFFPTICTLELSITDQWESVRFEYYEQPVNKLSGIQLYDFLLPLYGQEGMEELVNILDTPIEDVELNILDKIEVVFDYETGWFITGQNQRSTIVSGKEYYERHVEKTSFTLLDSLGK